MPKTVFVGMSGGVDSSVSAIILKNAGYDVVGVYMKNWSRDLPGMRCPWAEDLADAKRIATRLDLDFLVFDFEKAYKEKVVDYMLSEFQAGRTPNPDVICNEEIKFKLFFEESIRHGADYIATGHYARIDNGVLKLAEDSNKDQTYFLYRMSRKAAEKTLFPLSELKKPEVKQIAADAGFPNAYKKESMGVCFVGDVGIKDFLKEYLPIKPGEIRELETKKKLGTHEGVSFYTIGQRHGLYVGGGLPYYVVKKDLAKNILYVSKNLNSLDLWTREINLDKVFIRSETEENILKNLNGKIFVRLRHRAPLIPAILHSSDSVFSADENPDTASRSAALSFTEDIKRPAPGQSAVFYTGDEPGAICLGGGVVK